MKRQNKLTVNNYNYNYIKSRTKNILYNSNKIAITLCILMTLIGFSFNVLGQCGFEWVETTGCTVDFEVITGTGIEYDINMGDPNGTILNSANGSVFSFQYDSPGSYTLVLTYYNKIGNPVCGASWNIFIVNCNTCDVCTSTAPDFSFTVNPNANNPNFSNGCLVEFSNFVEGSHFCPTLPGCEPDLFIPYYEVDYGDGSPIDIENEAHCDNHEYSCNGTYEVCLTYVFPGPCGEECRVSKCKEIEIEDCAACCNECDIIPPTLEADSLIIGCNATICAHGGSYDTLKCCAPQYFWTVDGEPFDDTDDTITYPFECDGFYEVCLIYSVINHESVELCSPEEENCITIEVTGCNECLCEAPSNLHVLPDGSITWDPVPGAVEYTISSPPWNQPIIDCRCENQVSMPTMTVSSQNAPPLTLPEGLQNQCFVWQVQTVCDEDTESVASEQQCYPGNAFLEGEGGTPKGGGAPIEGSGKDNPEDGNGKLSSPNLIENISVFPNPASNYINVQLITNVNHNLYIQLIDQSGRTIIENETQLVKGYNQINFNTTDLPHGIYVLKFSSEHINEYTKLILTK